MYNCFICKLITICVIFQCIKKDKSNKKGKKKGMVWDINNS